MTSINRPPFGGTFSAEPPSGIVRQTEFELSASGWTDDDPDDLPLLYSFAYTTSSADAGSSSTLSLGLASSSMSLWTTLPVAGTVYVSALVQDQFRSVVQTARVQLLLAWQAADGPQVATTTLAGTIINSELDDALSIEDVTAVQSVISSASALLAEPVGYDGSSDDQRASLRTSMIAALDSSLGDSTAAGTVLQTHALLINQVTAASSELTADSRLQAADLVADIAGATSDSVGDGSLSTQSALFATLSNVLVGAGTDALQPAAAAQPAATSRRSRRLAKHRAMRRSRRRLDSPGQLADSVSSATNTLATVLLSGTVEGESFNLSASQLSMRVTRCRSGGGRGGGASHMRRYS